MTEEDILAALDTLGSKARAKGLKDFKCSIELEAHTSRYIHGYFSKDDVGTREYFSSWCADTREALQFVTDKIAEQPSQAERERNEYLKRLASAIEYGKKVSIDDDLLNPLIAQMKALSANVIEHKPTTPAPLSQVLVPGDDIPF